MRAYIVVDLGFGDNGKGLLTDFLARHFNAGLVVRYNGGAQAGHNVTAPDGRQHTFSQFGSGSFNPGVKTFLSRHVVIHPGALLVEGDILVGLGLGDVYSRLRLSDQALVVTPFHQAANHLREMLRGEKRHGSCGVGVGEAVEDALADPVSSVLAGDLSNPAVLRRKCRSIREHKRHQLAGLVNQKKVEGPLAREWDIFEREEVIETWVSNLSRIGDLGLVVPDSQLQRWLQHSETVIFEGAQGVLLDADAGFHPFTTWSNCTAANAIDLIQTLAPGADIFQIGVLRCHAVRHGPGPLPSETDELTGIISEHNRFNEWQGPVRYGWFDAVLARYALGLTGRLDSLVVTHLDVLSRLQDWRYCPGYEGRQAFAGFDVETEPSNGVVANFHPPRFLALAERARFTQALCTATPLVETCVAEKGIVLQKIESLLGQPVGLFSDGPRAENVHILNAIPT